MVIVVKTVIVVKMVVHPKSALPRISAGSSTRISKVPRAGLGTINPVSDPIAAPNSVVQKPGVKGCPAGDLDWHNACILYLETDDDRLRSPEMSFSTSPEDLAISDTPILKNRPLASPSETSEKS
jgi:hypothetical protein